MTENQIALIIQTAALVAAVIASTIALVIASKDRRVARLQRELDMALRLLENRNHGGSTDAAARKRLGAEALTLVGTLGERRLPLQWKRQVGVDDAKLRSLIDSDGTEEWVKDKMEAQLAVNAIRKELDAI